ncbi:hypothetical protein BKE30_14965 [Alkanindiges hydrocarboniclasticus]|jgi:hypothetical protein|uniref:Secreted protein n=2 Tax=Alkanindiges hydrocarboniclasticus TaxID=1907941 RepID=A0A1S8CQ84_9GAMM|nr:hypothetical protein BKE30_14965 [Alkanindiges hydrocarboniclasticus]
MKGQNMNKLTKGLVLLVFLNTPVWAEQKLLAQDMQAMSDDEMELVSDHDSATSAQEKAQKTHDHHHDLQNDNPNTKPQESIIYSIPKPSLIPLR